MKFSKPISREVEVDGNTFVVTFSDIGLEFRLKGKRRTARADWTDVLNIAKGEQGESARELLGVETGESSQREAEPQGRAFEPQNAEQNARPFQPQRSETTGETSTSSTHTTRDEGEEVGRAVTAGEVGPES